MGQKRTTLLAAGLIVLATVAAYCNSLRCEFVFDDAHDIVGSSTIGHLWPIWDVFIEHNAGQPALNARPVVNLSFAINYATGGMAPLHYHLTNLLIHVLAGLTLFGIVRRTLLLPSLGQRFAASATPLALAVALIWTLHPLQTESVTYIVQRYESMMGLFYLLALYAAIRCGTSVHPRRWAIAAVSASLLAMGSKEVAVSVPLSILLYDRAFLAGSFREAWCRRRGMYLGLAATWAAFAVLVIFWSDRSAYSGYALPVSWIEYAQSQFGIILHYLRLSFWPHPLVLDYGWPAARTVGEILPGALVIGGMAAATTYALVRWPKWGFLGAWFFMILAPTSSIMPLADLAFEHRMYLSLAAVVTSVVIGVYLMGQWLVGRKSLSPAAWQVTGGCLAIIAGVALGIITFQRNADYSSNLSIWADTVDKVPGNQRAHNNLGIALAANGQVGEAIVHYQKALKIDPHHCLLHNNLGAALASRGQIDEAIAHFHKALKVKPDYAEAHYNLGKALAERGQVEEAMAQYRTAVDIKRDYVYAVNDMAWLRATYSEAPFRNGAEAVELAQRAVQMSGGLDASILDTLAAAYAEAGRFPEAVKTARKVLELATRQNNQALAESVKAKIRLYEAGKPFREAPPARQ